jgi:hypothetical protein
VLVFEGTMSHHGGFSEVLFKKVDQYVDSLAPQIQSSIATELERFQQTTIDSLETQVVDAFRSIFINDKRDGKRNLNDSAPDSYGGLSLPFADEIAKLTRNVNKISDEADDDLRDIFSLTEGRGGLDGARGQEPRSRGGARGFLSSALNAVQDHIEKSNQGGEGQNFELGGLLGVISNTVKEASRNPEEKARLISPEIKASVGEKLRAQHGPIAEQFTYIALDHVKRWLRSHTSSRDLGDGAKAELEGQVKDLVKGFGHLLGKKSNHEGSSRGIDDINRNEESGGGGGGFQRVLSDKLSTGLAKVHREVRLEFRKVLGGIEKQLFEFLPDQFQRPLEKILGGNPFDPEMDRDAGGQAERSFGDDIKTKLLGKIRDLVGKVQETLRESILGVVNGGHRKFERESWVFVQTTVEQKIQRYLPDVKINVPDDIGNEGVSVGALTSSTNPGMPPSGDYNNIAPPSRRDDYNNEQRPNDYYDRPNDPQQGYNPPPRRDDYQDGQLPNSQYNRLNDQQPGHNQTPQYQNSQGYQNEPYQQHQGYQNQLPEYHGQGYQQPNQYQPLGQNYPLQSYPPPPQNDFEQGQYQGQPGNEYPQQNYQPRHNNGG